ncbi:hypothetical protein EGW08_014360 [Elysia chlorotica]|uniref:Profilin n=1 Tax=Elysia chlorotica TaxID=188477 RepID=A0A3S1B8V7_ELYCH|nr:hypothetical protein EGW08_014360 [Elysia chlorotica]
MSWNSYVETLEKGVCKYAAIVGRTDDSSPLAVWAESADKSSLNPGAAELISAATSVVKNDNSVMGNGIVLGGVKFACIRFEMDTLICQGKADCKDYSLIFSSTGKVCLIGFNPDAEVKTPKVREAVDNMRDWLKNAGY